MPFLPSNSVLNTLNEFKNLEHTITYTDELNISYPVTISATLDNPTVMVSGNTISGYYSEVFDEEVNYRTDDDRFITVDSFEKINLEELYGIYYFKASLQREFTYTYVATANGETKNYVVIVQNDWTKGRDDLLRYLGYEKFTPEILPGTIFIWLNNQGDIILWLNDNGDVVNWEN